MLDGVDWLQGQLFPPIDTETMPALAVLDSVALTKLSSFSSLSPRAVSVEEMLDRSEGSIYSSQEKSFNFLKREVAVRLAHMIMELQHLPKELQAESACQKTIADYCQSFGEVLKFEDLEASDVALEDFRTTLLTFRQRHEETVHHMALAYTAMKETHNMDMDDSSSYLIFNSIKLFLDRFYTSRISIRLITNLHLALCAKEDRVQPNHAEIVKRNCDIRSILSDVVDEVTVVVESNYMAAPKVDIEMYEGGKRPRDPLLIDFVPGHLSRIFREILMNSMVATVENHFHDQENLPAITVSICQANDDFTIKISDQGGGMDRDFAAKSFLYQYRTKPRYSNIHHLKDGSGLPLARLYARYFQGDIKMASYEGYGTDVYIYLKRLPLPEEKLPVYNSRGFSCPEDMEDDWSSGIGTRMMQNEMTKNNLTDFRRRLTN